MQHYFSDQRLTTGQTVWLDDQIGHHLTRVLRATVGDQLQLVGNDQQVYLAEIHEISGQRVAVAVKQPLHIDAELPVDVTIVSGLSKKNKPEWIVQKATELGAAQVIFLPLSRSIAKWDQKSAKKVARLQEVAQSAAEQSHRNRIPKVGYLSSLRMLEKQPYDVKLIAYEEAAKAGEETRLVTALRHLTPGQSLVGLFGPEGGITEEEVADLTTNGYLPVGLGPRILRTETAPMYLLTAISVMTEMMGS